MSGTQQFTEATHGNHVPEAVRRASERADTLAREAGVANAPPAPTVVEVVPPPAPAPAVVEPPAPVPAPAPVDHEQRYNTLKGKYDAEVPALRAEVQAMQRLMAVMNEAPAPRAAPPPPPAPPRVEIDPADVETYGEDLVRKTRNWARAEVSPELDALRKKVADLESGYAKVSAGVAGQSVQTHLDADPEIGTQWRVINENPDFLAWLKEVDWQSGQARATMLQSAYAAGDAKRTGRFFKTFLSEHTAAAAGAGAGTGHTEVHSAAGPSLESLAAPGRGTTSPPAPPQQGQNEWTRQKIAAFYRDVMKGVYRGRDLDKNRIEQEIHAAVGAGRVTQ